MEDLKNLFISYELSLMLKEKGFNEPCFGYFNSIDNNKLYYPIQDPLKKGKNSDFFSGCTAPLYQQVIDWFREKHNLILDVFQHSQNEQYTGKWKCDISILNDYQYDDVIQPEILCDHYYESLNRIIEEALKLI